MSTILKGAGEGLDAVPYCGNVLLRGSGFNFAVRQQKLCSFALSRERVGEFPRVDAARRLTSMHPREVKGEYVGLHTLR